MPKLSIIVPIYNAAKYLPQCIDSILSQTFTDFELILVNDGSTDESEKICLSCKEKDSRIKYVFKENGGVASARKVGLECSSGEYIGWVDSDDWIEIDTLRIAYDAAKKEDVDIVCFGIRQIFPHQKITVEFKNTDMYENFLCYPIYMHSVWNKLIKKSLFEDNDIDFGIGIITAEDLLVLFQLFHFAKKVSYIENVLYNYRCNSESVSNTPLTKQKVLSDCIVAQKQYLFCKKNNFLPAAKRYIFYRNKSSAFPFIWYEDLFDPDLFREYAIRWNYFPSYKFGIIESFFALCTFLHLDLIPKILINIRDKYFS